MQKFLGPVLQRSPFCATSETTTARIQYQVWFCFYGRMWTELIQSLLSAWKKQLAYQFNFTYRYIDDVLSINNPDFKNYPCQMYPTELEMKIIYRSGHPVLSYLELYKFSCNVSGLWISNIHWYFYFPFKLHFFPLVVLVKGFLGAGLLTGSKARSRYSQYIICILSVVRRRPSSFLILGFSENWHQNHSVNSWL